MTTTRQAGEADGRAGEPPPWASELLSLLRQILEALRIERPSPAIDSNKPTVSLAELAEMAGIGLSTAERLRAAGQLPPALRTSKRLRFRRSDVEKWLQDRTEPGPAHQPPRQRR